MTLPLLYANNADVPYPLDMFTQTNVPNDLLLDLCLCIPAGYTPVVGAIRNTPYLAYVSIEDKTTGAPLAMAAVPKARMAVVYPLTMSVAGSGWIVFGPGVANAYYSGAVAIPLDPETVVQLAASAPVFNLHLNGAAYPLENLLTLLMGSTMLTATVEGNTVYLDRNDGVLSLAQIADLTAAAGAHPDLNQYVYSIGGVAPDENGNVDIDISGCFAACNDVWSLPIPRSDLGIGEYGELPLDVFANNKYQPDTPCFSSEPGGSSEAGGCQQIIKIAITDAAHAIGTLYTVYQV